MKRWIQYVSLLCLIIFCLTACKTTAVNSAGTADITETKQGMSKEESTAKLSNIGYTDIVNQNQYRQLYLASGDEMYDDSESPSLVIDHGSYYEVTQGQILADTCYDLSLADGKEVGDTLQIDNTEYHITQIIPWDAGDGVSVLIECGPNIDQQFILSRDYNDNFYTRASEDGTDKDSLYHGSLYFSKDCNVTVPDPIAGYSEIHAVSINDLFTKDYSEVGAEFGFRSGELNLWGSFKINSSGLITTYSQFFIP